MADEYAIRAREFLTALREQRESRLPGGLYHLTQLELAYNSNRIEGSQLSADQTRYLFETRTVIGDALVDDVLETTNHFRAFDVMVDHVGEPITAEVLQEYHRILKTGTSDADREWFAVGGWKRLPNEVGGRATTPPDQVDEAIADLLRRTPAKMSFEDICRFHHDFERIHPFQDGNGRVGRLVMFEQCLAHGVLPFVVLDHEKAFYHRGLHEFEEQPGLLFDTMRHFQDRYHDRFKEFVPGTGHPQGSEDRLT
ncbi:Fic family protein [uncultured Tessaracoccus sp.]|uniref:Fic family protein n=1 Tax=uncultured Tessaracoccus sp. TaxID=905023 RepID=UPI0025F76E70|nr:Fic family protein [uncultured Tessaracoccus sp.]